MMTYSLIIPIYNEERTLPTLLKKLHRLKDNIEIIIIDDGSNDNTKSILNKNNTFIILNNKTNEGKGASIKKGVISASNQNIILMDGDLEVDIEDIPLLISRFERSDKDALAGIRWNKDSKLTLEINTLGNFFINSLFNLLYKTKLNDVLCCVKILNADLIRSLNIQSNDFSIEIEIMAKLVNKKYAIEEVIIQYERRSLEEGKKLKFSDSWNIIWIMIKLNFMRS